MQVQQAALPESAHPGAKKALAQIWNAKDHALPAAKAFDAAVPVCQARSHRHA